MKKSFTTLIAAVLIISMFSACGSNNASQTSDNSTSQSQSGQSTESSKPDSDSKDEVSSPETDSNNSSVSEETTVTDDESSVPAIVPGISYDDLDEQRSQIVATANSLIGTDYVLSGDTPEKGFDNSGFIYYVLRENGYINCPRGTDAQMEMGTQIGLNEVLPGDIMFFVDIYEGEESWFGGIYVGDGKVAYSPYPGEKVKYGNVTNSYWTKHFRKAVRVL